SLAAWGSNFWGQLNVPAGNDFVDVVLSFVGAMALRSDGSIVSWGGYTKGYNVVAPAGSDIIAIGPGYDAAFLGISLGGNHTPAKPAMPAGRLVGGVHTGYPGL